MNMGTMKWKWNHQNSDEVLSEEAIAAENRLTSIKKAAKCIKKGVEDSLKTATKNRSEDLESRKKRTAEYALGEQVAQAVHCLNETTPIITSAPSPLNTILERFGNLEKTIGHMIAASEAEIYLCIAQGSDTPISKLLGEEIPSVTQAKKDLDQLIKKQHHSQVSLEKEEKRLEKLRNEEVVDPEALEAQEEKRDRVAYDLENVNKDVALEKDKLTSSLLTLVSRENRYARSVLDLMKLRKQFYENAFLTIEAELPNIEKLLLDTQSRPVFGEELEDHLRASRRSVAYPIALSITYLRDTDLNDEGLFRISPKQIKLDKFKAHLDSHQPIGDILLDGDVHLHSALLKSYLRELPVPLLGKGVIFQKWMDASLLREQEKRVRQYKSILVNDLSPAVQLNIQYILQFLSELTTKSRETKMTSHNFAIVLGPTLLWVTEKSSLQLEQSSVESVIKVVADLIDNVHVIFPDKIDYDRRSEDVELRQMVLEKRMEAIALYSTSGGVSDQSEEGAVGGAAAVAAPSTGSQPSTPQLPPSSPGHRLSLQVPGQQQLQQQSGHHTAIPRSLTADSPSPNHKRKASIRSMGRNFIAKINPPGGSSSSNHHHHASKTPSPKEDLHHQHHGGGGGGGVRHDSDSGGGIS